MDIKKILIIAAIVLLAFIGFNYYSSAQSQKARAVRVAETEALRNQIKIREIDQARNTQIQQDREELEGMPVAAQKIIATKESQTEGGVEYQDINAQTEDRAKLDDVMDRWSDASILASRTSRIALSNVVQDMQSLRREADKLVVTPCLTRAQANLLVGMDSELTGYLKFMADSDASITQDIVGKYEAFAKYYEIVKKCTD
ncbi:hypothetical protein Psyc_1026 [Psychrobacter arcticus 273-4]|uniref:Uncharacterized protein n=1 Tax=Psychrobacter arcticus (strain DSM 17307 / VKM B-2377 / 273-4) TaxID=259536 RepID=Q4FSX9_PSYA2|nr:hypothetical protein [Psychrobacter arcticus]AAZ18879.1 hypothetical protein Psyc_1026 [Psychrobacter arcticus 273-4]